MKLTGDIKSITLLLMYTLLCIIDYIHSMDVKLIRLYACFVPLYYIRRSFIANLSLENFIYVTFIMHKS